LSVNEGSRTTAEQPRKRAPRGLKAPGRAFFRRVTTTYELSEAEFVVLEQVCRTLDLISEIQAVLDRDGSTVTTASGALKIHPHVPELRQQRAALGKLLVQLALPDEEGNTMESVRSRKARRAAQTRWRSHNTMKAANDG
jgi:hypothetical protein